MSRLETPDSSQPVSDQRCDPGTVTGLEIRPFGQLRLFTHCLSSRPTPHMQRRERTWMEASRRIHREGIIDKYAVVWPTLGRTRPINVHLETRVPPLPMDELELTAPKVLPFPEAPSSPVPAKLLVFSSDSRKVRPRSTFIRRSNIVIHPIQMVKC